MTSRIAFISICALSGIAAAHYAHGLTHHNPDLVLVIITVFSVFAGFLIAIIAILGDPALLPDGSWRAAEVRRDNIERRLYWHVWLFVLYLITIGALFVGVLIAKVPDSDHWAWAAFIEQVYVFFAVFSFLLSFALPFTLMKIQRARVDAEIKRRRQLVGIQVNEESAGGQKSE